MYSDGFFIKMLRQRNHINGEILKKLQIKNLSKFDRTLPYFKRLSCRHKTFKRLSVPLIEIAKPVDVAYYMHITYF